MAEKVMLELEVDTKKSEQNLKNVGKEAKSAGKGAAESKKGFDIMAKGVQAVAAGAAVITLLVKGFELLKGAFTSSEAGQDKYEKAMAAINAVMGVLSDLTSKAAELLVSLFENPQKALNDFAGFLKQNIINRFEGFLELIPQLGKAINQLFTGDFSGAAKTAANAAGKAFAGVENITEKLAAGLEVIKDLTAETEAIANRAIALQERRNKANKVERELLISNAKARRDGEILRGEIASKTEFSLDERLAKIAELGALEDDVTKRDIAAKKERLDILLQQNTLSNSNIDDLNEEAALKAELIDLETARAAKQKEIIGALEGARAEQKAIDDLAKAEAQLEIDEAEAQKLADAEADRLFLVEKQAFELSLMAEGFEKESVLLEAKYLKELELADKFGLDSTEVTAKYEKEKADITKKYAKEVEKVETFKAEHAVAIASLALATIAANAEEGSTLAKTAAVGNAIIQTYQGATAAFASLASIPVIGVGLGTAAASIAVASGLANVKKIISTDNGSKAVSANISAPVSAGAIPTTTQPPEFGIAGDSDLSQYREGKNQTVRAFIVHDDIERGNEAAANIDEGSSF